MEKKIIRLYWLLAFLFGLSLSFFFATYVVFLVSNGLDLLQVNLINCFFMAGVFVLEVPTGVFSDLIGRKKSYIIACFCFSLSMFVYYLSGTFWMFVIAELIAALAHSFFSGSLEAWLVDSLKYYGHKGELNNVFKREQQFGQIGVVAGAFVGGYVGMTNLALPWLYSSIGMALFGIFCCFAIKEEYALKHTRACGLNAVREIIAESVKYGVRKRSVLYIICFGAIFAFVCQALNMQWQIMFKGYGLNTDKLGWIFVGISVFIFIGNQLSSWFLKVCRNEKEAILLSQLITGIGILLASYFSILDLILTSFLVHEIGRGSFRPLIKTYINKRIPSEQRSTIISFNSMAGMVGTTSGLIMSGWLAKNYSISTAWFFSALVLLIAIPIFFRLKNGE